MVIRNARFVPHHRPASAAALLAATALVLAGCTVPTAEGVDGKTGERFQVREPSGPALVLDSTDPAELALTASQAFFHASPVAVIASAEDADARSTAAATGAAVAAPVLLTDGGVSDTNVVAELERLGAGTVVVVGGEQAVAEVGSAVGEAKVVRFDPGALSAAAEAAASAGRGDDEEKQDDAEVEMPTADRLDEADVTGLRAEIPDVTDPRLLQEILVAVDPKLGQEAAIGTALAAGAVPVDVPGGDVAAHAETVKSIRALKPLGVVGIGGDFGSSEDLGWQVAVATSGATLPDGSLRLFPGRYVSTSYAVPAGVADPAADAARAVDAAATNGEVLDGAPLVTVTASVRSGLAGDDGDYVDEQPLELITPAVEAIRGAGQLVLLDVAPGNQPLAAQLDDLEPLLSQPGVGLSVHPEFRAAGNGADTGAVPVAELQAVVDRLAKIATARGLPQIMLEVHQSTAASVVDRADLAIPPQVAVVFTAAGPGEGQATADGVWADVASDLPAHTFLGWSAPSAVPADATSILPTEPLLGLVSAG
ncbi:hypothetical protein C8K30_113156 [Promicromonospora sp. AC04]|uniref:hypothetical protein n=1 Tax=Promicromonospora sp. AC04 TaxID=2135723 RepID=UPI000D3C2DFB|nr:hypothetical protein [Promicromonospora sp. AC04]PUB22286.1 hypothetical protein C8K30_113156 [Promicromonospora sp. AC04]